MPNTPRPIDHCVLPVADLNTARSRYEALGFTVAPEGVHPFGTKNACVYFADDTFLEPLAIGEVAAADKAIAKGNVFVARDREYRSQNNEGFSAMVVGTDDAAADHRRFVARGISAGPMLDFSRGYTDAEGRAASISFRLAFAAPQESAGGAFFFSCQRIDAPPGGRGAFVEHQNGALGIEAIWIAADEPESYLPLLQELIGSEPVTGDDPVLRASNAKIRLSRRLALAAEIGREIGAPQSLTLAAIVFMVGDLKHMAVVLDRSGIAARSIDDGLAVDPVPGQGATLIFRERR